MIGTSSAPVAEETLPPAARCPSIRDGGSALAPHRIEQQPVPVDLDERRRVAEPCDAQADGRRSRKIPAAPGLDRRGLVGHRVFGAARPLREALQERCILAIEQVPEPAILPLRRCLHRFQAGAGRAAAHGVLRARHPQASCQHDETQGERRDPALICPLAPRGEDEDAISRATSTNARNAAGPRRGARTRGFTLPPQARSGRMSPAPSSEPRASQRRASPDPRAPSSSLGSGRACSTSGRVATRPRTSRGRGSSST